MLQNSRVTALTDFELLRDNQLGGGVGKITSLINHTQNVVQKLTPDPFSEK